MLLSASLEVWSSVFFRMVFRSRGYLVSLWCGLASMSASFRRLHCLFVSAHCYDKRFNDYKLNVNQKGEKGEILFSLFCCFVWFYYIICLVASSSPWCRSWGVRCLSAETACIPYSSPPPYSTAYTAGTWRKTIHTNKTLLTSRPSQPACIYSTHLFKLGLSFLCLKTFGRADVEANFSRCVCYIMYCSVNVNVKLLFWKCLSDVCTQICIPYIYTHTFLNQNTIEKQRK